MEKARLFTAIGSSKLIDLHTHLMGTGNADFWLNNILLDEYKLPSNIMLKNDKELRVSRAPLVWDKDTTGWYEREVVCDFFDGLVGGRIDIDSDKNPIKISKTSDLLAQLSHFDLNFEKNFSWDVVLVLEDLAKAFNIHQDDWDTRVSYVEERLGIGTCKEMFKRYIIFNEREQQLNIVYGITVGDLRDILADKDNQETSKSRRENTMGHLRNAFSMLDPHGNMPQPIHFHIFKGEFKPQFYPMRYALKDSIYSQRLDILTYLLFYNLKRYSKMPTRLEYVEFSVGVGDICRPWVFDVLTSFGYEHNGKFKGKFSRFHSCFPWMSDCKDDMVQHKFLAGFGREKTDIKAQYQRGGECLLLEEPSFAISLAMNEISYSKESERTILFNPLEEDLKKLISRFESSSDTLSHWIVGLDWFGDEKGYPFCTFVTHKFVNFVQERRKVNSRFGIRIHCAENIPTVRSTSNAYRMLSAHMYITYLCLKYLNSIFGKTDDSYPIRIGHGVGFINLFTNKDEETSNSTLSTDTRKSAILINAIQNDRSLFYNFLFEINLTSNSFLLYDRLQSKKKIDFPFILCTDDDGIWPIDNCKKGHNGHFSLAAEYCNAIYDDYIENNDTLINIITNARHGRFFTDEVDSAQVSIVEKQGSFELEAVLLQGEENSCNTDENCRKVAEYAQKCCKSDNASRESNWEKAVESVINTVFKTNSEVYAVIETNDSTVFFTSESPSSTAFLENASQFLMAQFEKDSYPPNLRVEAFCGYFDSETVARDCKKLPGAFKIRCFSNSYKHKYFSDIPVNVSINSAPMDREGCSYFYCICTHGSMITAALHFIAKNMDDDNLAVLEHNLPTIENLIVPFAKQQYEYYSGGDAFFKDYNLPKSPSKFQIESSKFKVARWIEDSKTNARLKSVLEETKSSSWADIWRFIDSLEEEKKEKTIKSIVKCYIDYKLVPTEFCIITVSRLPSPVEEALVPIVSEKNKLMCCKKVTQSIPDKPSDALLYFLEIVLDIKRNSSYKRFDYYLWKNASLVFKFLREAKDISSIKLMAFVRFSHKVAHWYDTTEDWCYLFEELIEAVDIQTLDSKDIRECLNVLENRKPYKLGHPWQKKHLTAETKEYIQELEEKNSKSNEEKNKIKPSKKNKKRKRSAN
eukprot:NODE_438_length_8605_cov_0.277334.p1 type:complete len:1145 gc:universal NODE_438_length_8605_cov_0.277334:3849-7283(+)